MSVSPRMGTRYDQRSGQYYPTIDGIDQSPTSFDPDRAREIAQELLVLRTSGYRYLPAPDTQYERPA